MGTNRTIPLPKWNCRLVIVLVEPQNEGNIGAVARVMRNFGLHEMRILRPKTELGEEVRKRAKHAQTVIREAKITDSWDECFDDINLIIGTSGKREMGDKVQFRHFLLPEEFTDRLSVVEGNVAIVFGPEGIGLGHEELRA